MMDMSVFFQFTTKASFEATFSSINKKILKFLYFCIDSSIHEHKWRYLSLFYLIIIRNNPIKNMMKQIFLIFLIICLINAADWTKLDDLMRSSINERVFPGAVVIVANENGTIFKKAYGTLTYGYQIHNVPVTNDTKYDVASVTKMMATTFGMMSLVSSNILKLDDLVSKYVKNYDTNKKGNTTLGNLLLHNSGLPYDYPGPLPRTTQ